MLNSDIDVIYRKPNSELLFLKNKFYGTLFQISEDEYEIIRYYADHPDVEAVQRHFIDTYELPSDVLNQLLTRATTLNLLVTDEYASQRKRDEQLNERRSRQLTYFVCYINLLLAYIHLRLTPKFKGNIHYYQLFTVQPNQESTRWSIKASLIKWISLAFTAIGLISGFLVLNADSARWDWHRALDQSPGLQGTLLFIIILFCILISTFLHEGAHYLLYRYYGGMTCEVGMALMMSIVPVVFVNTNSLYLWDSRKARMWVTGSGILMDSWQLIVLMAFYVNTSEPIILFLSAWLLIFVGIRFLTNLNVFIPGTDGYFLYCDFWHKPDLYQKALSKSRQLWASLRQGNFNAIVLNDWLSGVYVALSVVSIAAYYLLFAALILIPLFIRFFY